MQNSKIKMPACQSQTMAGRQNDKLKFKIIKIVALVLVLSTIAHFLNRYSNNKVAGMRDTAIDWEVIDPLVSLLPREVYAAAPGQTDPMMIVRGAHQPEGPANRELYREDKAKFMPDPTLGLGSMLSVQRALPIEINDGGEVKIVRTWTKSIGQLLDSQSIEIGEKDQLTPAKETPFAEICHLYLAKAGEESNKQADNMSCQVTIIRVSETEVKEIESISFTTKTKNDPALAKGITKIDQKGQRGQRAKYYLVRRENGQTVSKKFLRLEIVKEPLDEIIFLGTQVIVLGEGRATWFGAPALTAAHNSLPRGTMVRVTNQKNSQSVVVKIIGGGIQGSAIIDLSADAFKALAPLSDGVIPVRLEKE